MTMPAVVVLALTLPALSGVGVLHRIKAAPATQPIPVVVFSGSRERPFLELCYEIGANAYVVKPAAFSDLVLAVRVLGRFWTGVNRLPSSQKAPLFA
ncbi:response regulator (plasmid) [Azospirillum sp. TSA2s]|nr:response regulator [Azospirillum sp. TSA2s]